MKMQTGLPSIFGTPKWWHKVYLGRQSSLGLGLARKPLEATAKEFDIIIATRLDVLKTWKHEKDKGDQITIPPLKWVPGILQKKVKMRRGDCEDFAATVGDKSIKRGVRAGVVSYASCTTRGQGHVVLSVDHCGKTVVLDENLMMPWTKTAYRWVARQIPGKLLWRRIKHPGKSLKVLLDEARRS